MASNDTHLLDGTKRVTIDVLANDSDPDADEPVITSFTQPAMGSVVIDPTRLVLHYTPKRGFTGTDTFSYTISDGFGGTSTATVQVSKSSIRAAASLPKEN